MPSQRLPCVVRRELLQHKAGYVWVLLVLLAGCATVDQRARVLGYHCCSRGAPAAKGWSGTSVLSWTYGVAEEVRVLLQDTLTADGRSRWRC